MLFMSFGINKYIVNGEEETGKTHELAKGVVYEIGDTIQLSNEKTYIMYSDCDNLSHHFKGTYTIGQAEYNSIYSQIKFVNLSTAA